MISNRRTCSSWVVIAFAGLAVLLIVITSNAQTQTGGSELVLTATPTNVGSGDRVKINIMNWSTREERRAFVAATIPGPPPASAAPRAGGDVPFTFGGVPGAQGAAAAPAGRGAAPAQGAAGAAPAGAGAAAAQGAAGATPAASPFNPVTSLLALLDKAPSLGMLWTGENTGYSIKYAYRASMPDGGERIILATNRRVASLSPTPNAATAPDYTIIEMKLDSKGVGEAKASLNTKVVVDFEELTLALANYTAAPAVLKNVKK